MNIWTELIYFVVGTVGLACAHGIQSADYIKDGILYIVEQVLIFVKDCLQGIWFSRFLPRMYLVTGR
jgi:hypothetical protein